MATEAVFHARDREWAGQAVYAILIFDNLFHPAVVAVVVVVFVAVAVGVVQSTRQTRSV